PQYGFLREVGLEPGKLRIGYMAHAWNGARSERTMIDAVERVALRLEHLGHRVEPVTLSAGASWDAFVHATTSIWTAWLANGLDGIAAATGRPLTPDTLEPATLASYQYGIKVSAADYLRALDLRNAVTRAIGAWFHELDVLLTPTLPGMPLRLGLYQQGAERLDGLGWTERVLSHAPFSAFFNMAGTPAMSMPLCTDADSGLPVGLQFAA